jgi:hypothetical protein
MNKITFFKNAIFTMVLFLSTTLSAQSSAGYCSDGSSIVGNVMNGIYSGGSAEVVSVTGYSLTGNNDAVNDQNTLGTNCNESFYPYGTLCDYPTNTGYDGPLVNRRINQNTGATWVNTVPGDSYGSLLVDLGSVNSVNNASVFQMFSDGKTTDIEGWYHPYQGPGAPADNDIGWLPLFPYAKVGSGAFSVGANDNIVSAPLILDFTERQTRYVKFHAMNDGSLGDSSWIEIRSIKLYGSQNLDLKVLGSFEAFTGIGAITNAGAITGDIGTNAGALTGSASSSFNGNSQFNNAITKQADIDLMNAYIHLNKIFETHPGTHAPAFGSGEIITPGVYSIGGAGSVALTLTLDGQGDPNAVFIMKFKGAFTAGAATNIILINGADAANVYWVAQGAISIGANSTIKGTLLAYPGAITLGANSSIEGRLLSSVGAITVAAGASAIMPAGAMHIPINSIDSYAPAAVVDVLGSVENFSLFTSNGAVANASTSGIIGDVGADIGAISGFATSAHIGEFYNVDLVTEQAKTDLNNAYTQLMLIPNTVTNHTPAFGSGETLAAGVYTTAGAGSLAGTITLDGAGDPNAIFIFKFNGAFSAGAQSRVILSNGTRRYNVFWISEGAASIGSFSTIKGTVIAHNGAATMAAGGNLEGRLLSTGGAIGFSTGVVYTLECAFEEGGKSLSDGITFFEESLKVYPNPSKGIFNIKLTNLNVQTDVYLYDITGKLIARKSISKENNSGSLIKIGNYNLSSGIYLVKIITKEETITKKVIIETNN